MKKITLSHSLFDKKWLKGGRVTRMNMHEGVTQYIGLKIFSNATLLKHSNNMPPVEHPRD